MMSSLISRSLLVLTLSLAPAAYPMRMERIYSVRPAYGPAAQPSVVADVAKVAAGVGFLAVLGYGLYKVCDWLFSPSNEQLITTGFNRLQEAHINHDAILHFIENSLGEIPENPSAQKKLITDVNEPLLYGLAAQEIKGSSCSSYFASVSQTINNLRLSYQGLVDRQKTLYNKPEALPVLAQMQSLSQEINVILHKLKFIHEYGMQHQSYFALFEQEARLMRLYEFELNGIETNNNAAYVREVVRVSVMKQAAYNREAYPYMRYVECLYHESNSLERSLSALAYNYSNRIGAASVLLQKLKFIYNLVIVENAYHQELLEYKKEQLEKQKIEAQHAQAAAAAAQAAAMQQQVWQLQHQNALHAAQIQATHEQNALIAAQTLVNAVTPSHVNVYL